MNSLFASTICSTRSASKNSTFTPLSNSNFIPCPCISGLGSAIPMTTRPICLSTIRLVHKTFGGVLVIQGSRVVKSEHPDGSMSRTSFSNIVNSACSPEEKVPRCAWARSLPRLSINTAPTIGSNLLVCSDRDYSISSTAICMNLRSLANLLIFLCLVI